MKMAELEAQPPHLSRAWREGNTLSSCPRTCCISTSGHARCERIMRTQAPTATRNAATPRNAATRSERAKALTEGPRACK